MGAMIHTGAKQAHLVTTGRISKQAEVWSAGKPIVLVDGSDLIAWVNRGHRLKTRGKRTRQSVVSPSRLLLFLLMGLLVAGGLWWNRGEVAGWLGLDDVPAITRTLTPPVGVTPLGSATPTLIIVPAITPDNNPIPIPPVAVTLPGSINPTPTPQPPIIHTVVPSQGYESARPTLTP